MRYLPVLQSRPEKYSRYLMRVDCFVSIRVTVHQIFDLTSQLENVVLAHYSRLLQKQIFRFEGIG